MHKCLSISTVGVGLGRKWRTLCKHLSRTRLGRLSRTPTRWWSVLRRLVTKYAPSTSVWCGAGGRAVNETSERFVVTVVHFKHCHRSTSTMPSAMYMREWRAKNAKPRVVPASTAPLLHRSTHCDGCHTAFAKGEPHYRAGRLRYHRRCHPTVAASIVSGRGDRR